MKVAVDLIFVVGWIVFWGYWIIAAAHTRPGWPHRSGASFAIRLVIVVVLVLIFRISPQHWDASTQDIYLQVIGLVLFVAGLVLAIWARLNIRDNWGFPMSEKQGGELITSGPYKFIRHPIYSGILLASIGTALGATLYWLIVLASFAIYFIWSAVQEEKYMASTFPKVYLAYKRTSKMFIPFIL